MGLAHPVLQELREQRERAVGASRGGRFWKGTEVLGRRQNGGSSLVWRAEVTSLGPWMSDQQPTGKNVSGRQGSSHTDMEDESKPGFSNLC